MKVLNLALKLPEETYLSPWGEADQIYACLLRNEESAKHSNVIPLPKGKFSIDEVLKCLPKGWSPDVISLTTSLVFRSRHSVPTDIKKLGIPFVIKLTDTHHQYAPIQKLIDYCLPLEADFHWTTYDRHHIQFFREAGLKNVFWIPASYVFPLNIRSIVGPPPVKKNFDIIFRGTVGDSHPHRRNLIEAMKGAGLAVDVAQRSYLDCLKDYPTSHIVFNCSLNGDLNRRIFESVMSGGFLLTDRLPDSTGLSLLLAEGKHFEGYADEKELVEKARFYLAHPEKARMIAEAGQKHLQTVLAPERIRDLYTDFLLKKTSLPELFTVPEKKLPKSHFSIQERIFVYEFFQEMQRINPKLKIACSEEMDEGLRNVLSDFSRIQLVRETESADFYFDLNKIDVIRPSLLLSKGTQKTKEGAHYSGAGLTLSIHNVQNKFYNFPHIEEVNWIKKAWKKIGHKFF